MSQRQRGREYAYIDSLTLLFHLYMGSGDQIQASRLAWQLLLPTELAHWLMLAKIHLGIPTLATPLVMWASRHWSPSSQWADVRPVTQDAYQGEQAQETLLKHIIFNTFQAILEKLIIRQFLPSFKKLYLFLQWHPKDTNFPNNFMLLKCHFLY